MAQFAGGYYMMTEPETGLSYDQSNEPIEAGLLDQDGHLQVEDLYGVQTIRFTASVRASLEELANNPQKAVWRLPSEAQRFLQKVTSKVNRTNATKDDLIGDPSRAILLKASVKQIRNQFPIDWGLDINGLMPNHLTSHGRHNFVLYSNTAPTQCDVNIFEPESIFNKLDYSKYGKLTPEALKREIMLPEDKQEQFADIKVGGIAWDLLIRNAANDHYVPEVADELLKLNEQLVNQPFTRKVQVPVEIGKELYDGISAPLAKIDQSFVDMRKTQVRFSRLDGEPLNSFNGLVGDAVGLGADDGEQLQKHHLATPYQADVDLEIQYVCF